MSRCAHGTSPAKRCRNSAAVLAPARRPAGALLRSPKVALTSFAYSACSGRRQTVRRSPARPRDAGAPVVVVAHQAGVGVAEGDDAGAGQGRQVDEPLGALGDRVGDAVGEHEAPLGVGVVDLDGQALERLDDVAGPHRAAARDVLGRADDADHADRQLELGDRRDRFDDARRRPTCRTSSRPWRRRV